MTIATLAKLAARGDIGRDERVVAMVTGDGLKTIDAVRDTFEVTDHPGLPGRLRRAASRRWRHERHGQAPDPAARRRRRRDAACPSTAPRWARPSTASTPQHGELQSRIADDDGALRRFVNVYLKGEDIRFLDGLEHRRSPTATR